ncbi:pantoate--beta-alanine ligase [Neisseriaceae bacterium PsAf]|nr:pantoate--beta-alanine ligase [Neisseriaceae bacterium PsAf]
MIQLNTIEELHHWRSNLKNIALVPTMGNLHEGHLNLIREAKKKAAYVVVSIFVNPTQFGENEDFGTYPRTLAQDIEKAEQVGADAIFSPSVKEMYPYIEQTVWVTPGEISTQYCGKTRPIHFRGVATVVAKLLNIVQPEWAFFGKKDFQQLVIIKQMVEQLNFRTSIIGIDTKRDEKTGLALSSRNQYLNAQQQEQAPQLYQALLEIKNHILNGNKNFNELCQKAIKTLSKNGWDVDYIEVAKQHNLQSATCEDKDLVVLGAAKLGSTRLIDNIDFSL